MTKTISILTSLALTLASFAANAVWAEDGNYGDLGRQVTPSQQPTRSNSNNEIPRDAKLIYQVSEVWETEAGRSWIISRFESKISENEEKLDLDFKCRTVIYQWNIQSGKSCYRGDGWGPGGCYNPFNQIFGTSKFYTETSVTVNAYCQERSYDQKVIMSLQRRCEQNPTAECLNENIRTSFRELQPTLRYNIGKN